MPLLIVTTYHNIVKIRSKCQSNLSKWITKQEALKKSIPNKWRDEISPYTFPKWNIIWHKAKAPKEVVFLWLVILKTMAINGWCGKISANFDMSVSTTAHSQWNRWNIGSLAVHSLKKDDTMLPTLCDNSLPK